MSRAHDAKSETMGVNQVAQECYYRRWYLYDYVENYQENMKKLTRG